MTTLVSLALAMLGSRDPAPLTLDIPACRIEVLAAKIEEASHIHLEIAPNMRGEVVGIRIKEAKLDDLLARIGKVMYATWVPIPGGQRLEQTPTQHLQEQQIEHANRLARCKVAIDKIRAELVKLPPLTSAELQRVAKGQGFEINPPVGSGPTKVDPPSEATVIAFGISQRQPLLRLMKRVAASITPEILANMADEDRVVLSSVPTRMQRPLASGMMTAVNDFVSEQNRFAAAMAAMPHPKSQTAAADGEEEFDSSALLEFGGRADGIARVRVALKTSMMGDGVEVDMRLLLANGTEAFTNNLTIETGLSGTMRSSEDADVINEDGKIGAPKPPQFTGPDIEFSPTTKAVMAELRNFGGRSEPTFSPELSAKFADPVTYEPLAIFASDFALGASPGNNVVARLTDATIIPIASNLMDDRIKVSKARAVLTKQASELIEEADGWATITPMLPYTARHNRCDRAKLKRFLYALHDSTLNLDQYADMAHGLPGPMENPLVTLGVLFGGANYMGLLEQAPDWLTLQFYGALSLPQRKQMQQGGTLTISQLSAEARAILEHLVYIEPSGLSDTVGQDPNSRDLPLTRMAVAAQEVGPGVVPEMEPTEALPIGLVPNSLVHGQKVTIVVGSPVTTSLMLAPGPMPPDELGFLLESSQTYTRVPTTISKFHMGRKETVTFDFQFAPAVFSRQQVSHAAMGTAEVDLSAFPTEFIKAVNEARKIAKDARALEGQAPRRGTPPPK